jgi:hypothetical protein
MRVAQSDLDQIAGYRYGFMIADLVLGDTLTEFADGSVEPDEVLLAIQQHRYAYEGYLRKVRESLSPATH